MKLREQIFRKALKIVYTLCFFLDFMRTEKLYLVIKHIIFLNYGRFQFNYRYMNIL